MRRKTTRMTDDSDSSPVMCHHPGHGGVHVENHDSVLYRYIYSQHGAERGFCRKSERFSSSNSTREPVLGRHCSWPRRCLDWAPGNGWSEGEREAWETNTRGGWPRWRWGKGAREETPGTSRWEVLVFRRSRYPFPRTSATGELLSLVRAWEQDVFPFCVGLRP